MLKDIITEVAGPLGLNPQISADRLLITSKINRAAKDLWEETDLIGSLLEQFFTIPATSNHEITLPHYVGNLRGVRSVNWKEKLNLFDMAPRYYYGHSFQSNLSWRIKNRSPLHTSITNSAPMVISIPTAETTRIIFYVNGTTTTAKRKQEQAIIEAGSTSVTLSSSFEEIFSFGKNIVTDRDCTLTDSDGNEMSVIPNILLDVTYPVIQILDKAFTSQNDAYVIECLFKQVSLPLINDYDQFVIPEYDDVISWKTLVNFYMLKEGQEQLALTFQSKVAERLRNKDSDASRGTLRPIQTAGNRYIGAMRNSNRGFDYAART